MYILKERHWHIIAVQLSIIPTDIIIFYADQKRMVKCGFSVLNDVFGLLWNKKVEKYQWSTRSIKKCILKSTWWAVSSLKTVSCVCLIDRNLTYFDHIFLVTLGRWEGSEFSWIFYNMFSLQVLKVLSDKSAVLARQSRKLRLKCSCCEV